MPIPNSAIREYELRNTNGDKILVTRMGMKNGRWDSTRPDYMKWMATKNIARGDGVVLANNSSWVSKHYWIGQFENADQYWFDTAEQAVDAIKQVEQIDSNNS